MATYRILSLDGGGTWALLQVMALQKIYEDDTEGHHVLKDFNLVAANGAGSVVLAGLMLNMRLNRILSDWFLNEELRRQVFAPSKFMHRWFGRGAKYSTKSKRAALKSMLGTMAKRKLATVFDGERPTTGLMPQILICAYDCDRNRAEFFRSDRASRCASATAADPWLVDAVHAATTAPPPMFDLPATGQDGRFWDGAAAGLYNPVLAAVTEARGNRIEADEMQLLSIGTGTIQLPVADKASNRKLVRERSSFSRNSEDLLSSVLYDPANSATFVAHVLLGLVMPGDRPSMPVSGSVIRLNPVVRPIHQGGRWEAPEGLTEDEVAQLASLHLDTIKGAGVSLIKRLVEKWVEGAVLNQPIRSGRDFTYEIGHPRFSEAVTDWNAISREPD